MAWYLFNTKPSPNVAVKYINFPVINTYSIWVIQGIWNIINSSFDFWCSVLFLHDYFCICEVHSLCMHNVAHATIVIPPHNEVVGGYTGFTPSVRPSVRLSVLTWALMWITSMGNHGAAGGISERRHSSCSSLTWSLLVLSFGVGLIYMSPLTISVKDIPGIAVKPLISVTPNSKT